MLNIYYAKTEPFRNAKAYEKGLLLLPAERVKKLERIQSEEVRCSSMAAGLLMKYGLEIAGILAEELIFETNSDGKPYLKNYPELFFNISHSGEYAALAVSDKEIGIDTEKLRTGKRKLANRFFSKDECAALDTAWSDSAFTRTWTRKESYIKATGMGMRMPLNEFSTVEDKVNDYYLESFFQENQYWLSVCQKEEAPKAKPQEVFLNEILFHDIRK